jgi:antitoxin component YwqK of YwqJK toxin-antitoxin module
MIGEFSSSKDGLPSGSVRILPVASYKEATSTTPAVLRQEFIMDNTHKVGGGSLYDNKGKLLYRGEMKNGVPHGYGTGYYANGKVGHTGMFKGGKIV